MTGLINPHAKPQTDSLAHKLELYELMLATAVIYFALFSPTITLFTLSLCILSYTHEIMPASGDTHSHMHTHAFICRGSKH